MILKTKNKNNINYKYSFCVKFKMVEIEFNILFYENNNNLIKPSNITYNNDF